ncbi:MAG: ATP-binding cassette domain-containing protein [Candidatus Abyssobacteria bacterium SURF_17]|uniref:ATP-binding cassette domain-containing protein n=1 Tax=Candidatus Abyssobacteria bacterium SURF_17 TaxID=2093361 RepID=A0A419ESV1_9BACT|nr:MAG: ATP-binding cassette domain-containing protein [Candidatus Abyssubacteria bacterium SURF_17]
MRACPGAGYQGRRARQIRSVGRARRVDGRIWPHCERHSRGRPGGRDEEGDRKVIITLDLCLRHGSHEILDGLNLHIEKGEFVFICGQAGSGKTSLLRTLVLERMPAAGRIIVDGRDITEITGRSIAEYRRGLGIVFQDDFLLPRHSLVENIALALEIAGWRSSDARGEALVYLRDVGLSNKADLFPRQVSENEKQMVKICRAVARRPKIVLADEPYEGLDWQSIQKVADLFRNANLRGSTAVIATHHVEFAQLAGKRSIMLDQPSFKRMAKASGSESRPRTADELAGRLHSGS